MKDTKNISPQNEIDLNEDEMFIRDEEEEVNSLSHSAKIVSPGRLVLKRFFRSKLSVIGLGLVVFLFAFSFLGPPLLNLCGYKWSETTMDMEIIKSSYNQTTINYTYGDGAASESYEGYLVSIGEDRNTDGKVSASHWLGTDENTFDVFIRLMYGGRMSLLISFIVIFLEMFFGIVLGSIAGYFGKIADQIIMRIVDILFCIPSLPILLIVGSAVAGMAETGAITDNARIYVLMVIITFLGWAGIARLVRGQILMLRDQEFMIATEALGLSVPRKIFRHLFPNILPQLIVSATLGLGGVILMEATLSYLGLGVQPPSASWGGMISRAKDPIILAHYMNQWVPPGILIVLAVLGFNFMGDGLRDAFDPKAKR